MNTHLALQPIIQRSSLKFEVVFVKVICSAGFGVRRITILRRFGIAFIFLVNVKSSSLT